MADRGFWVREISILVTEVSLVDHLRKQIRDAAVAALTADLVPGFVKAVDPGRVHTVKEVDLPHLSVYTPAEVVDRERDTMEGDGSSGQFRRLEILLEIRDKVASTASPNLLASLDAVALEAERSLESDATLTGLLQELDLAATATELEGESTETPVGVLSLTWSAVYRCQAVDPAVLA